MKDLSDIKRKIITDQLLSISEDTSLTQRNRFIRLYILNILFNVVNLNEIESSKMELYIHNGRYRARSLRRDNGYMAKVNKIKTRIDLGYYTDARLITLFAYSMMSHLEEYKPSEIVQRTINEVLDNKYPTIELIWKCLEETVKLYDKGYTTDFLRESLSTINSDYLRLAIDNKLRETTTVDRDNITDLFMLVVLVDHDRRFVISEEEYKHFINHGYFSDEFEAIPRRTISDDTRDDGEDEQAEDVFSE